MFMDRKLNIVLSSSQLDLKTQHNCNQNLQVIFGYWQYNYKIYMERQKTQNNQGILEEMNNDLSVHHVQLQDLLSSYNN